MSARVTFEGLAELEQALRDLPATLAGEAADIVQAAAEGARGEIAAAYPEGQAGHLRKSLKVERRAAGPAGVIVLLRATAKEAGWFESGTQTRQTKLGANRGAMPAGNVFYPRAYRWHDRMFRNLAEMLRRNGLTVTGL